MAICNLFKNLTKDTGNFLMFSQYTEDLTKATTAPGFYRVVPSKFIAIKANYNKPEILKYRVGKEPINLNRYVPLYFQNDFENGCALMRKKLDESSTNTTITLPEGLNHWSTNIFWNSVVKNIIYVPEDVKYIGDINIQSYDEYDGMGYSEIYCFIPNDAALLKYSDQTGNIDKFIAPKQGTTYVAGYDELSHIPENWTAKLTDGQGNIPSYNYGKLHEFLLEPSISKSNFDFNTIVILYDVKTKNQNGEIITYKKDIPMGIYFTGTINKDGSVNNTHTKYINNADIYDSGTSYGLRICSRFITTPDADSILNIDIKAENASYSAFCLVMSAMADTQSKMNEILDQLHLKDQAYNELYAIFKNSRTNVPYIKSVAGEDYWFVNGRKIGLYRQSIIEEDSFEKRITFYELVENVDITSEYTKKIGKVVFDISSNTFLLKVADEGSVGNYKYYNSSSIHDIVGESPKIGNIYIREDLDTGLKETYMGVYLGLSRMMKTKIEKEETQKLRTEIK